MPDYKNGKIYKLWSIEGEKIYIGSTTQPLYKRLNEHKKNSNNCKSKLLFDMYEEVKIELIENYSCENKQELNRREGEIMRLNKEFIVNDKIAGRTLKEFYQDNKEEINEKHKQHYEENKEQIKEKHKEYREVKQEQIKQKRDLPTNKEKVKEYLEKNKEKIKAHKKEWRVKNIEQVEAVKKVYREKNKEQIRAYQKEYRERKKLINNIL